MIVPAAVVAFYSSQNSGLSVISSCLFNWTPARGLRPPFIIIIIHHRRRHEGARHRRPLLKDGPHDMTFNPVCASWCLSTIKQTNTTSSTADRTIRTGTNLIFGSCDHQRRIWGPDHRGSDSDRTGETLIFITESQQILWAVYCLNSDTTLVRSTQILYLSTNTTMQLLLFVLYAFYSALFLLFLFWNTCSYCTILYLHLCIFLCFIAAGLSESYQTNIICLMVFPYPFFNID